MGEEKKVIVYLGGFELPDRNAAAQRVISNGKLFKSIGYDVKYIGVSKKNNKNNHVGMFESWDIEYPSNLKEWIKYLTSIKEVEKILNEIERIDIIICYNYQAIAMYKLKKFCEKRGIKIISDCTEWYQGEGNIIMRTIKNIDTTIRMKYIHKKINGVITISEYLSNYYKDRKVLELPALVDINEEKWKCNEEDKNDIITFNYAGSPGKNKDKINEVIEVLSREKYVNYKFLFKIIGITEKQYLDMYPYHFKEVEKIRTKLLFLGRVSHENAIKEVKESDYTIFIREDNRVTKAGFPTKFSEAFSCGVPVITTKSSNLNRYLIHGDNGYFIEFENLMLSLDEVLTDCIVNNKRLRITEKEKNIFDFNNYKNSAREFFEGMK